MKQESKSNKAKGVFHGMKVFLQREVPFHSLYFVLRCGGATVGWSHAGSPLKESDSTITHQIIDRPSGQFEQVVGREYIQPQWVLDSFNENRLLSVEGYLPDKTCPPHLSPFVNDEEEGYVPKQRELLNKLADDEKERTVSKKSGEKDDEEDAEEKFTTELKAEAMGVWASDFKKPDSADAEDDSEEEDDVEMEVAVEEKQSKKLSKKQIEEQEELERRKSMMPKKHKRLYHKIENTENKKKTAAQNLSNKRNYNKKTKKKMGKKGGN